MLFSKLSSSIPFSDKSSLSSTAPLSPSNAIFELIGELNPVFSLKLEYSLDFVPTLGDMVYACVDESVGEGENCFFKAWLFLDTVWKWVCFRSAVGKEETAELRVGGTLLVLCCLLGR